MTKVDLLKITKDLEHVRKGLDIPQIDVTAELSRSKSYLSKIAARSEALNKEDSAKYLFFLLRAARKKVLSTDSSERNIIQAHINELMNIRRSLGVTLDWQPPYSRMKPEAPNFILEKNVEEKLLDGLQTSSVYNFTGVIKGPLSTGKSSALLWAAHIAREAGVKHILAINMNHVFDEARIELQRDGKSGIHEFPVRLNKIFHKSVALQVIAALRGEHVALLEKALEFANDLDGGSNPEYVMQDSLTILLEDAPAMLIVDGIDQVCLQFLSMEEILQKAYRDRPEVQEFDQIILKLAEPILLQIRRLIQKDAFSPSRCFSVLISYTFDNLWPDIKESSLFFEDLKASIRSHMREEDVNKLADAFDIRKSPYATLEEFIGAHPFLTHVFFYESARARIQDPSIDEVPIDWLNIILDPRPNDISGSAGLHLRKIAGAYKRYGDTILRTMNNISTLFNVPDGKWLMGQFMEMKKQMQRTEWQLNEIRIKMEELFSGREEYRKMLVELGIISEDISVAKKDYFPFASRFHAKCFYDDEYLDKLHSFANP